MFVKGDTTCEMVLIINAKNENENVRLFVTNEIVGTSDWLDVYPDEELQL